MEGSVPLTALGSTARLAEGHCLLAQGLADDLVPGSVDDLVPGLVDDLVPGLVDDLAPSSADDLAPGLVDDIRRKMGFLTNFQNIPSRSPHPVTLHLKRGAALLTSIGPAGMAEDGYPLALESTYEILRSTTGPADSDKISLSSSPTRTTRSICQVTNCFGETPSATNQTRLLALLRSAKSYPAGGCHVQVLLEECRVWVLSLTGAQTWI